MDNAAAIIPFSGWEQAVFVCLFIVLVVVLVSWFGRQQEKWQAFMTIMNEFWQSSIERQRKEERETLGNISTATSLLVQEVKEMRNDLRDHDATVGSRIESIVKASVPVKSRPRKDVGGD